MGYESFSAGNDFATWGEAGSKDVWSSQLGMCYWHLARGGQA